MYFYYKMYTICTTFITLLSPSRSYVIITPPFLNIASTYSMIKYFKCYLLKHNDSKGIHKQN